jgi:iron complex outermembrane receptor protein
MWTGGSLLRLRCGIDMEARKARVFFFEKKKQITFGPELRPLRTVRSQLAKVFCFFFSKKNCFLAFFIVLHPQNAGAQAVDYGSLEQLFGEPITTSATGKPQRASDVPADMVIITQDDIRRSGADTIPDILQFVTGIDVRRYNFADTDIGVRGYDSPLNPRLLVLVDGRQVYSDVFAFEPWNAIPIQLSEIRQIEVVRGPNSALFGFNAVSGVVNIITFDPLLDNANVVTVRGGTQGYGEGEVVATQHIGTTAGVRVSAGGWTATGFAQPSPASVPSPRYASYNIDARWQALPWLLLSANGGYTDAHTLSTLPITVTENFRDHLNYWGVGAAAQTRAGTIDLDIYRNQDLHTTSADGDNRTIVVRLSDLAKLDADNTLRGGLEYRNNAVTSLPLYGGKIDYDVYAASLMWDWQLAPSYELTNAVRVDHLVLHESGTPLPIPGRSPQLFNSTSITAPSFNSGLVIHPSALDSVRITADRGVQVPSLADFDLQLQVAPHVYALGVPTAGPTAVWNAEVAYDRSFAPVPVTLETALFFQRNTGLLAAPGSAPYRPLAPGIIASPVENFGSSNEEGLELGLRGTSGGFRWNASYRYDRITQDELTTIAQNQATDFRHGTPTHAIIVGAGYTLGKWEFDVQGRFQTKFTDYGRNTAGLVVPVNIPDYVTLNARIGYKVTDKLTIAATAEQFDAARILNASAQYIDRRFFATATYHF